MTDRAVKKDNNISSSSKNNEVVQQTSSSHHHHHQSQQKDVTTSKPHEDITNDTFNQRYKIIEKIGEGSYSEVLKCQNRLDGLVVACKRLKHIYKSIDDVINISEVATLRTIQKHSNILQMVEIHYDKILGKVSLVFELMDINLYELIKDRKRLLPESRVRAIMFQLFRALRHLHKLGVFHRDIKPENILIKTKTDQLKLGDLGSVRGMFSRPPYTEYISTRWYRSPECLLTAGHYSHKMDVWAAGCVFYEVLTLRPLFPGSSEIDQINRVNNILGPPPMKLLETFQKQAEMERETYRGQSQLNRRQQIQKVLNNYSSRYVLTNETSSKSSNSIKHYRRNNMEFHFAGKEGTGLEKILPAHISREAKDIIKSCLLYDPEQRPTAQRIVQLAYFAELRESYAKNPEKVSSKPVVLICGDTVSDQCTPIELGTLGDHKVRYRRVSKEQKIIVKASSSKTQIEQKPLSIKSMDINNNPYKRGNSSSNDNTVVVARASQSTVGSKVKLDLGKLRKTGEESRERKLSSLVKSTAANRASRMSNNALGQPEIPQVATSKVRVRSKNSMSSTQQQRMQESSKKKQTTSSTTSFESVQTPTRKEMKYSKQSDKAGNKEPKSNIMTLTDISLSPYVKAPSELKFLQKKIKSDQHSRIKTIPPLVTQSVQQSAPPHHNKTHDIEQVSNRISVVPPKVAAAAIRYAKVNTRKIREPISLIVDNETEQTESSGTNMGGEAFSPTDSTPYGTESSIKVGKLRFRQTSNQTEQNKPLKTNSSDPHMQRSKIPVLMDEQVRVPEASRRNSKLFSTPPEQRRESGTTEKWRNTGIPRMIPMSPERERNIKLLKESLTLDKHKRVQIRYQQHEQDLINNNMADSVNVGIMSKSKSDSKNVPDIGNRTRKGVASKNKYDYTSPDTLQSTGEQPRGTYSSAGGGGRYRNSTTDYENPDAQETSSASAAALENQQRNLFNAATRKGFVNVPPLESVMKKPVVVKKPSEMYPPEMLDLYSSRYRGPDVKMNILKDSANNNYVKRSNPESRAQDVKDKLNYKFELRRQRQLNNTLSVQQVGDQPSKLLSERSGYVNYSSSYLGAGEEDRFSRAALMGGSRVERRPPVPPVGVSEGGKMGGHRGYRDVAPEAGPYTQHGRRASQIPTTTTGQEKSIGRMNRRSISNAGEQTRKDKESERKKAERMRSTMRDDVFCSSDDDVVISMRKKFDSLISERARKLSESLKTNVNTFVPEVAQKNPPRRKALDSNSDDEIVEMTRRPRNNGTSDKSRKYARRELRARMAESLTMNNFSVSDKWATPEHVGQALLESQSRASNSIGDWVLPTTSKYTDKSSGRLIGGNSNDHNLTAYNPPSVLRARKTNENEFQNSLKYHQTNRIHPFPVQEQQIYRRGQIFTPPSNKPAYQSTQFGSMLHDRKLRYSHNTPMPVTGNYGINRGRGLKEVDMKKQQRIQ